MICRYNKSNPQKLIELHPYIKRHLSISIWYSSINDFVPSGFFNQWFRSVWFLQSMISFSLVSSINDFVPSGFFNQWFRYVWFLQSMFSSLGNRGTFFIWFFILARFSLWRIWLQTFRFSFMVNVQEGQSITYFPWTI